MTIVEITGGMLRAARSLTGLSQQELAERASISRPCLTASEGSSGSVPNAKARALHRVVSALGLRLSPGLTSSVRDRARRGGTTVHGALCAALLLASPEVFAAWREMPLRILSPINARPLLGAGESCGIFLGAATSVFDRQATNFWDIARDARIGVAVNQTSENIAAQLSAFRRIVGNGAEEATVAEL